jgi:hypothetical protein
MLKEFDYKHANWDSEFGLSHASQHSLVATALVSSSVCH